MNKKKKKLLCLTAVLGTVLCLLVLFLAVGGSQKVRQLLLNIKTPYSYTWDEYSSLSNEEKDQFYDRFDSVEDFEDWMEAAQAEKTTEPDFQWNKPGKTPDEYTWEEYGALTDLEKEAFYLWFLDQADFESWLENARPKETDPQNSWESLSAKQPDEYTWEEYQKLSPQEQDAFYLWFASREAFEAWMKAVKPTETNPTAPTWDKKPDEYTWAEYQSLSPEEQDAFYLWFKSEDAFEAWVDSVTADQAA